MIVDSFGRYLARTAHDHGGWRGRLAVAPARGRLAAKGDHAFERVIAGHQVVEATLGWFTASITSAMPQVSFITRSKVAVSS